MARRSTLPPLVLLLLGVQLEVGTCFSAVGRAPHAGATAACVRSKRPSIMVIDDNDFEDEENSMVPYEDWNLAWQRFNLEYVAAAYEVYEEYEDEGSELDNVRLQTLVGTLVACAVAALCLYEYCVVTGGIVIAPSEHALIELHNFSELQNMPTAHLRELHIPGASMREAMNRALQDGGLAGWRSTLVSRTYRVVLEGVL